MMIRKLVITFCLAITLLMVNAKSSTNHFHTLSSIQLKDTDSLINEYADHITLQNGIVSVKIIKSNAHISSYRYKGFEMLRDGYYSMDGGTSYAQPNNCIYSVKQQGDSLVDVSFKSLWEGSKRKQAFDIDIHFVIQKGLSGVYSYAILNHPNSFPKTGVGEWRMVWKLDQDLFDHIVVDSLRTMEMPNSSDFAKAVHTSIPEAIKLTSGVKAGKYECKYNYSAEYYDIGTYGHASNTNKIGAWMVLGGYDYFNDGPTAQDLNSAAGIIHLHFGRDHYAGSGTSVNDGEHWSKLFGPFLLYLNADNAGVNAMWADARKQVIKEKAKWPYNWLTDNIDYPVAALRGNVSGNFHVQDILKPSVSGANTWVGLTDPSSDWQRDSKHYQYWVKANVDGSFIIPNVRPGAYSLHAFVNGAVGEYTKEDITVKAGYSSNIGRLNWKIERNKGKLVWEIGIPDRSAKEFKYGDAYFNPFMWETYCTTLPNPIIYTVGKSDWSKDLNYVHSSYFTTDGRFVAWPWKINFELHSIADTGYATLTFAFASLHSAHLQVFINEESTAIADYEPVQFKAGGNALVREGIHAKYSTYEVRIPLSKLKNGTNSITLLQARAGNRTDHIMYDYISLEMPEK